MEKPIGIKNGCRSFENKERIFFPKKQPKKVIVMPVYLDGTSACGKTRIAREYGPVDVDFTEVANEHPVFLEKGSNFTVAMLFSLLHSFRMQGKMVADRIPESNALYYIAFRWLKAGKKFQTGPEGERWPRFDADLAVEWDLVKQAGPAKIVSEDILRNTLIVIDSDVDLVTERVRTRNAISDRDAIREHGSDYVVIQNYLFEETAKSWGVDLIDLAQLRLEGNEWEQLASIVSARLGEMSRDPPSPPPPPPPPSRVVFIEGVSGTGKTTEAAKSSRGFSVDFAKISDELPIFRKKLQHPILDLFYLPFLDRRVRAILAQQRTPGRAEPVVFDRGPWSAIVYGTLAEMLAKPAATHLLREKFRDTCVKVRDGVPAFYRDNVVIWMANDFDRLMERIDRRDHLIDKHWFGRKEKRTRVLQLTNDLFEILGKAWGISLVIKL